MPKRETQLTDAEKEIHEDSQNSHALDAQHDGTNAAPLHPLAWGPADQSVQESLGNTDRTKALELASPPAQPQQITGRTAAQDEEAAPLPTPYPTVCVQVPNSDGTLFDECFENRPRPTVQYPTLNDNVLRDRVIAFERPASEARKAGRSLEDVKGLKPNRTSFLYVNVQSARVQEVVDWLEANGASIDYQEDRYIGAMIPMRQIAPLSELEAVSQLPKGIHRIGAKVMTEKPVWMIRGEIDGMIVKHFLNERVAYIGWWIGPIRSTDSKEIIRQRLYQRHPSEKPGAVPNIIGMLKRFSCEVQVGDHFVTYEPERRLYHIGIVRSEARRHSPKWFERENVSGYLRDVVWISKVARDDLSREARNCLGGQLTHFRLSPTVSAEIRSRL